VNQKKEISVWLIDDTIPYDEVFFTLNLHSESELVIPGDTTSCKFIIKPNEAMVQFSSEWQDSKEKWWETPHCRIVLDQIATKPLEVYFRVVKSESDADSGSDYTIQAPGFVKFMAKENEKDLEVRIIDDDQPEINEKFVLEITGVSDKKIAFIGPINRMTVEIESDEKPE